MLTQEQKEGILETIESEGSFEYAFIHYSDFKEIKDKKFHELREQYVDAHNELFEYIKCDDDYDDDYEYDEDDEEGGDEEGGDGGYVDGGSYCGDGGGDCVGGNCGCE